MCGLRVEDVDFMRGSVTPRFQVDDTPLRTDRSEATIPILRDLALLLSESVRTWGTGNVATTGLGVPVRDLQLQRALRAFRAGVAGLPAAFTFHDTRHHYASLLSAGAADIKMVQERGTSRRGSRWTPTGIYLTRKTTRPATSSGVR